MYEELELIRQKCLKCYNCPLGKTRTNIVFSDGLPNPKLMLIGEAPGFYEDKSGEPFVGKAGQLLDKILESVGFSRNKDVYICNTLKCRPPENRDPLPEEKEACREYLDAQIEILKPRIILLCGRVAVQSFLNTTQGITKIRGKWFGRRQSAFLRPEEMIQEKKVRQSGLCGRIFKKLERSTTKWIKQFP